MSSRTGWRPRLEEVLVIVASILLAFGIDATWAALQDREAERRLISNLLAEFEGNRTTLQRAIYQHQTFGEESSAMVSVDPDTLSQSDARMLVRRVYLVGYTMNLSDGVLRSYLSSGQAGQLSSEPLRHLLAAWPGLLEDAIEDEQRLIRMIDQTLMPFVSSRVPVELAYAYDGVPSYVGTFVERDANIDLERVLTEEGRSLAAFRAVSERTVLRDLEALESALNQVVDLLERER